MKGSPPEQDESLLENWIKELESGIKGMADVAGVPAEVSMLPSSLAAAWVYIVEEFASTFDLCPYSSHDCV